MPGGGQNAAHEVGPQKKSKLDKLLRRGFGASRISGEAVNLRVDFLPQLFPNTIRYRQKCSDDFRIKLASGPALDLLSSGGQRLCGAIGTVGGDGIEGVCYGE